MSRAVFCLFWPCVPVTVSRVDHGVPVCVGSSVPRRTGGWAGGGGSRSQWAVDGGLWMVPGRMVCGGDEFGMPGGNGVGLGSGQWMVGGGA